MFFKVERVLLALLVIAAPAYAQTAGSQSIPSIGQANPNAALFTPTDVSALLSSFLGTINNPSTGEKPEVLIQRAQADYTEKRFKDAMVSLQLAQDAVRRQHMDYYSSFLPPASGGWAIEQAKPEDTICLGEQIFGGVAALSRVYSSKGQKIKVTFITDAPIMSFVVPLLQSFAPLIAKGELAQGTIKGYPSIYMENKNNSALPQQKMAQSAAATSLIAKQPDMHVLTVLMENVIVTLSSETLDKGFLTQFANIIDYDKLKAGQ